MSQRQKDTVYGYARLNYDESFITDVVDIIHKFYSRKIASHILKINEEESLANLLFNTLKKQKENENIKSISTQLLYRASEHDFSAKKFHELCDEKGATITIIHNEYNHIFGGYTSKSWPKCCGYKQIAVDPNAFLFMVRPKCKYFGIRVGYKYGRAITSDKRYGPTFGGGRDIYIADGKLGQSGGTAATFTHEAEEFFGTKMYMKYLNYQYKVLDYEVFSVSMS